MSREGWEEVGENNVLMLDAQHFRLGTRIELTNPLEESDEW